MYSRTLWTGVVLLSLMVFSWFGCGGEKTPEVSDQFTADMTEQIQNESYVSKIFIKGNKYRMIQQEVGETLFVVVNQDSAITRVLVPSLNQYLELGSQDMMSVANDPFQNLKYNLTKAEKISGGKEKVGSYDCDKYTLMYESAEVMSYWMSEELNFPLKIIITGEVNRTIELSNIKIEAVDDTLFQIPAGYNKLTAPAEVPEETPAEVPDSVDN